MEKHPLARENEKTLSSCCESKRRHEVRIRVPGKHEPHMQHKMALVTEVQPLNLVMSCSLLLEPSKARPSNGAPAPQPMLTPYLSFQHGDEAQGISS